MTDAESGAWATGISAITLFAEDIPAAKEFYSAAFGLPLGGRRFGRLQVRRHARQSPQRKRSAGAERAPVRRASQWRLALPPHRQRRRRRRDCARGYGVAAPGSTARYERGSGLVSTAGLAVRRPIKVLQGSIEQTFDGS